ncbi:MAG TPA: cytochrome c peroxidase [Bryobacteraceae bacterium]|jgi:cytochrome c peroxidase
MQTDLKPDYREPRAFRARSLSMLSIAVFLGGNFASIDMGFAGTVGDDNQLLKDAQRLFKPLPKDAATPATPLTPQRIELGRKLFFDPRVSVDGTVSCSRCHVAALYATDGLGHAEGAFDKVNDRRAPTVLNAALQFKAHWRGERENVEDQATRALTGPASFGNSDSNSAIKKLKAIPGYGELFRNAFPGESDPISDANWGKAIGAFERTLMTPGRFDEYLSGNVQALSTAERRGLRTFINTGCGGCHMGPVLGGTMFQKFGIVEDYWKVTGSQTVDKGRFDVTHQPSDMYSFKVPGLRNVEMVPPYFHDGSVRTLPEAVRVMAKIQLGKTLSAEDTAAIVTFLSSLTGKVPTQFAEAPVLPPAAFAAAPAANTSSPR